MHSCPLCFSAETQSYYKDDHRPYERCRVCGLVFVPAEFHLRPDAERAHYDLHQNDPSDERYRAFLDRLCQPMLERLPPGCHGLDFGSGPGPTLSVMFEEAGHRMTITDPFYANDSGVFDRQYDFITASEVVEHLHRPRHDLDRLWGCLKNGGTFGVMTKRVRDQAAFATWHYIRDPTHVCFFSTATFDWLADHWQTNWQPIGDDVAIFNKRRESPQNH